VRYFFADCVLDSVRRELHRGSDAVPTAPQVFDLLDYLIRNRERVVRKTTS
jgi:adenylate cyclase